MSVRSVQNSGREDLPQKIWVCLVTKNNARTVRQTINALVQLWEKHPAHNLGLMVLNKSQDNDLLQWIKRSWKGDLIYNGPREIRERDERNNVLYRRIGYSLDKDSIQRARIQLMLASTEFMHLLEGAITWQIDDDIVFAEAVAGEAGVSAEIGRDFFSEVQSYHKAHPEIDAAIGTYSHVPPLPLLLYFQKQLTDIQQGRKSVAAYPQNTGAYHDLYADDLLPVADADPGVDLDRSQVEKMLRGIPHTRPLITGKEDPIGKPPQPCILRGGNFIVFNPAVLIALPHLAVNFDNIIGRRSDMIHASMLQACGFKVSSIELSLFHNRNFPEVNLDLICIEYLRDALGAVALRFLKDKKAANLRLKAHLKHLSDLIRLLERPKFTRIELFCDLKDKLVQTQKRMEKWEAMGLENTLQNFKELVRREIVLVKQKVSVQ